MKLQRAVGFRISDLLVKYKMTRYSLCKKISMSEQTLKHIIDERNKDIKLTTVALIASGFDLTLEEFFANDLFRKNLEVD